MCAVYSIQCVVCSVQCALWSLQCDIYCVQCTVCSVQCALWSLQCKIVQLLISSVCSVHCAVCNVQCAVCSVQFAVYSMQCTHYRLTLPAQIQPHLNWAARENCTVTQETWTVSIGHCKLDSDFVNWIRLCPTCGPTNPPPPYPYPWRPPDPCKRWE